MKIELEEQEGELFEEIITLYHEIKELMIYAEEIGGESFTPATEEFRYAFDHLMRVFAFKLDFKSVDADYVIENLKPAFSHLYRAAYNLLDYLSIVFREKVRDEMQSFSAKTLQELFPKYYQEIKPYFEVEAPKELSKLRDAKDIGEPNKDDLNKYTEIAEKMASYHEEILKIKPSLLEYENKTRDEKRKSKLWQIIIPVIATVIGIIIGKFLSVF